MNAASPIIGDLSNAPIYLKLASQLRQQIVAGDIGAGDTIPSERELCQRLGASRVTVRKAIEQLISEGLLVRKRGSGTFLTPRIEAPGSFLSGFSQDAMARGATAGAIWMMKAITDVSAEEAALLEIAPDARIARLARVRLADGQPLAIENALVPAEFLPNLDLLDQSLYAALDAGGNRPVSGTQRIRASLATPTESSLLSIAEKSEVLRIERLTRRGDGRPVELTRSAYRGDRYDFVSELRGGYAVV